MDFYLKLKSIVTLNGNKSVCNYVTTNENSLYHGIYHLNLLINNNNNNLSGYHDNHLIKLQLLLMDYKISLCSMWEIILDDIAILKHVSKITIIHHDKLAIL